ncbi:MAG: hypothetical protein EAZ71_11455 [Verrucomicrobia bacterium]|nr:MAG: hypothetical protein EAZ71_11455 [Verrucomicrobiota bacterium]
MNKLYWIVCDDKETNVFEGRYQGRTRGEALKFLKQALGRKTLNGLVFTITEIPVPLIREIVAEILAGGDGSNVTPAANVVPIPRPEPQASPGRYDAFADAAEPEPTQAETKPTKAKASKPAKKVGNPGHGDDHWSQVRAHWEECRSVKQTADHFGLSPNTLKTRIRREGWNK